MTALLLEAVPLVAYVSLFFSAILLWQSQLRPFKVSTSVGAISLIPKEQNGEVGLMIGLPITIYNKGAKNGVVTDLLMHVKNTDPKGFNATFAVGFNYDSMEYLKGKLENTPELFAMQGAFAGIHLKPKESVAMELLFVPDENSSLMMEAGNYKIDIYLEYNGKDKYEKVLTRTEIFGESAIANLSTGTITELFPAPNRKTFSERLVNKK